MTKFYTKTRLFLLFFCLFSFVLNSQTIRGKVLDGENGEELMGATVSIVGTSTGALTDFEGGFILKADALPATLKITYTGYEEQEIQVASAGDRVIVKLSTNDALLGEAVIEIDRVSNEEKKSPLTTVKLDALAIKETTAVSVYDGIADLPAIDAVKASMGFTVINMRGFNSTSPVRSLQIIDGVDNQAPGLNFSLGNFLGASDLDIANLDIIIGASSSFYGPNAFNGVVSMTTKDPFYAKGHSISLKAGERNLIEGAVRIADVVKNKRGQDFMAFKVNMFGLKAYDWVADNFDPISEAEGNQVFGTLENPGRFNAVNIYGDETFSQFTSLSDARAGLNSYHRVGYQEEDLVDYNTKNAKLGAALHFRLNPSKTFESTELILASNYGSGTTVYQGDNRFSLRGIQFWQNRIEIRKRDKFFIRAYSTNEDAGRSYDPYFTAQKLQEASKNNEDWSNAYQRWWTNNGLGNVFNQLKALEYPTGFNFDEQVAWQQANKDVLAGYHAEAAEYANAYEDLVDENYAHYVPGTTRFQNKFDEITAAKNNDVENGTRFFDKSALYHAHAEYKFHPTFVKEWVVGTNGRLYRPNSEGTIFNDSINKIKNSEFGFYTGFTKELGKFTLSGTYRLDKNQNFDYLSTPAASLVWNPAPKDFFRFSFSSAIRNPTLSDQYLNLTVGPATLLGNLNGFEGLATLESFNAYRENQQQNPLELYDIDPIQPEKVKTFEVGYRTARIKDLYIDAGYYYNIYNDFIGYNIGVVLPFDTVNIPGLPPIATPRFTEVEAFRVASNASQQVTSQGATLSLNYKLADNYSVKGSYSWNKLVTAETDPIVPAFNTPEHKFTLGFGARGLAVPNGGRKTWGFNISYKWIESFIFEGSPQFTGVIPSYDLLDAQINMIIPESDLTVKVGASNLLNNRQFQTYGGPRIGRMAYISLVCDFVKK